jgi:DNA (cytosine-5)-methyltransferase 1
MGNSNIPTSDENKKIAVIDLFCGAGGLAYGLQMAGLEIKAGIDLDPNCKYPIEQNTSAKFECLNIKDVTSEDINRLFDGAKVRVLAGCAPCQPFSTYSQSRKNKDERWTLLREFQRLALSTLPEIVTMENVPGLAKQEIWNEFILILQQNGYQVTWSEVDCTKLGIPQTRKRLVLLASRLGEIELLTPTDVQIRTVKDVIGSLPPIKAGQTCFNDPLHSCAGLSDINIRRIKASKPGRTWRDWPIDLRAKCHLKISGKSYPSVYGRMEWDKPAPTMTTQCYGFGNGRFGHPDQDRGISLREAAIIQSFPTDYKFFEKIEQRSLSKLGILIGHQNWARLLEIQ